MKTLKEWPKKIKKIHPSFRGPLERAFRTFANIDSSTPEGQSLLGQQSAPKLEAQLGPQSLIPQLLEVAFWILNNWDQAEEEERNWHENGQATAQAKLRPQLSAVPCNLRTTQGVPRKFSHLPGGKTSKGECFKCKSTSHWAWECQKEPPGPCPVCRQTGHWKWDCPQSWRGGDSSHCGDGHTGWLGWPGDSGSSPYNEIFISIEEPWVILDMAGKKNQLLNWYRSYLTLSWSLTLGLSPPKAVLWLVLMESPTHTCCFAGPHLPTWIAFGLTCLFGCAWVFYRVLGRDPLSSLGDILWLGDPEQLLLSTLMKTNQLEEQGSIPCHSLHTTNPAVWDKGIPEKATNVQPVKSSLKQKLLILTRDSTP